MRKKEEEEERKKQPLYDPLMTFCNMTYVLLCLKCHMHTFIQVSAQLEHFENFVFRTPL